MAEVEAKVAAIITSSQVAFNVGENSGVRKGDSIVIYRTVEVQDPDTKESLGGVIVPKLNLQVVLVQPKMCVAEVTDTVESGLGSNSLVISAFAARKRVTTNFGDRSINVVAIKIGEDATVTTKRKSAEPSGDE
jgi:hypothetical protein